MPQQGTPRSSRLAVNRLVLDLRKRQVHVGDRCVRLSPTEYTLLRLFMLNPDHAISKEEIFAAVWGYDFNGNANVIQTYVSYLRRKLGRDQGSMLRTLHGVGYVLCRDCCPAEANDLGRSPCECSDNGSDVKQNRRSGSTRATSP